MAILYQVETDIESAPATLGPPSGRPGPLEVSWAASEEEVRAAQRLRYQVFADEMGARIAASGAGPGLDCDRFDAFCDHLLVRSAGGVLVGTYRVLPPAAARRAGGYYSDHEFDLAPLRMLRARALELGRSCVHPDWRTGGVILALWSALGQYMLRHRLDTMIGCASIGLQDGGERASRVWHHLRRDCLVEPHWRVRPLIPMPLALEDTGVTGGVDMPPLINGYVRCGARLLGPPALDRAFNTADLPIMLRLDELTPRYRKHFLGEH